MSANFGWYEIMDRLSVIQNQIHDHVYEHQETDTELQKLLDEAQCALNQAYQYAGKMFDESWKQDKNQLNKEEK